MSEISLKSEYELIDVELEAVSGGGGSAEKGTSETVNGKGSGTVSGSGSDRHSGYDCHY